MITWCFLEKVHGHSGLLESLNNVVQFLWVSKIIFLKQRLSVVTLNAYNHQG